MEKNDYPAYYYILKEEMLGFLQTEEEKDAFLLSLFNWMCNT